MRKDSQLTYEDLLQIVELLKSSSQFAEFHLKVGEIEVDLRRRGRTSRVPESAAPSNSAVPVGYEAPARDTGQAWPEVSMVTRSPMVGTFYRVR